MTNLKRTVRELAELLGTLTGKDSIPRIARALREAGHLSQAGRGRGAALATSVDAACLLLVAMTSSPAAGAGRVVPRLMTARPVMDKGSGQVFTAISPAAASDLTPIDVLAGILDCLGAKDSRFDRCVVVRMDPEYPLALSIGVTFERSRHELTFAPGSSSNILVSQPGFATASGEAAFQMETPPYLVSRLADWLVGRDGGV